MLVYLLRQLTRKQVFEHPGSSLSLSYVDNKVHNRCQCQVMQFFNILHYNTVPVVLSGANMSEVAPSHSHINIRDFTSIAELASHLR